MEPVAQMPESTINRRQNWTKEVYETLEAKPGQAFKLFTSDKKGLMTSRGSQLRSAGYQVSIVEDPQGVWTVYAQCPADAVPGNAKPAKNKHSTKASK